MSAESFALLQGHHYMNLHSYRKSGEAVVTPVWFVLDSGTLYLFTLSKAGKLKRLRRDSRVLVGPCDIKGTPLGETMPGRARFLEGEEAKQADRALGRKYGFQKWLTFTANGLAGAQPVYLAIEPEG